MIWTTAFIIDWIGRMSNKYGGIVVDLTDNNKQLDWGQALCRECYGKDWPKLVGDDPIPEDVKRAKEWEAGWFSDWMQPPEARESHETPK